MLVVSCSMNVLTVIVRAKIRKVLHCKRSKCKKILTVVGKFSRSFFDRRSEKCCIALQFYLVKLMCWTKVDNFILRRILRWFLIWPQILRSISASLSITGSPNHGIWTFCEEFQPSFYAFFPFLGGQKQGKTLTGKKCWTNLNICILFRISCPIQRWNPFFHNSFRSPYTRQSPDHGIVVRFNRHFTHLAIFVQTPCLNRAKP